MNSTEYRFVDTDVTALESRMISAYERISGVSVRPASPERLLIQWVVE